MLVLGNYLYLSNNFNHNEVRRYSVKLGTGLISEASLNKYFKTSEEALVLIKEIEKATRHVSDGTKDALQKLMTILKVLKDNGAFGASSVVAPMIIA